MVGKSSKKSDRVGVARNTCLETLTYRIIGVPEVKAIEVVIPIAYLGLAAAPCQVAPALVPVVRSGGPSRSVVIGIAYDEACFTKLLAQTAEGSICPTPL